MELTELNTNQLVVVTAAVAFFAGCLLMRLIHNPKEKLGVHEDPRNHRIRELEADLRTLRRQFSECEAALEAKSTEFNTAVESLQELRATLVERDARIETLEADLKGSVLKTRELRQELQDRATETVREHVRAESAETELEVARAGSEAVLSEISRLQEERQKMSDTMNSMADHFLPDEEFFGTNE